LTRIIRVERENDALFQSHCGTPLTRDGVAYLIQKYVRLAGCGKTPVSSSICNPHYAESLTGRSEVRVKRVSACTCGCFCPRSPRAGTLLAWLMLHQPDAPADSAGAPGCTPPPRR
jgi:hypothetical protein